LIWKAFSKTPSAYEEHKKYCCNDQSHENCVKRRVSHSPGDSADHYANTYNGVGRMTHDARTKPNLRSVVVAYAQKAMK